MRSALLWTAWAMYTSPTRLTIAYGESIQRESFRRSQVWAIRAYPAGIYIDFTGTLYIADSGNQRIRTVFNGIIRNLPLPPLSLPTGIASDTSGGIYIADGGNHRILRRTLGGAVIPVTAGIAFDSARDA